jgi:hypothetical protein
MDDATVGIDRGHSERWTAAAALQDSSAPPPPGLAGRRVPRLAGGDEDDCKRSSAIGMGIGAALGGLFGGMFVVGMTMLDADKSKKTTALVAITLTAGVAGAIWGYYTADCRPRPR